MLGKRTRPAWDARRPEPIAVATRDGHRAAEAAMSPLERSPRGWRNRESAGVGLGIVAALEKSGSGGDVAAKAVMGSPRWGAPSPALASPRTAARGRGGVSWEGCGGGAGAASGRAGREKKNSCRGVFCGVDEEDDGWGVGRGGPRSPCSSSSSLHWAAAEEFRFFPTADFLSSCYLCKKKLHGEDIYMYRGEKAFCSMECRYRQIVIDEYQENYAYQAPKLPSDAPISDYSGGRLFYSGVAVA